MGETNSRVLKGFGKSEAPAKMDLFEHSFDVSTVKEIYRLFTLGDELERQLLGKVRKV